MMGKDCGTYVQTRVGTVDAPSNDLIVVHKDTSHGSFVGVKGKLGHFDGFAHPAFMVGAVGDGAEDHDGRLSFLLIVGKAGVLVW
jgi:hypothetical protein